MKGFVLGAGFLMACQGTPDADTATTVRETPREAASALIFGTPSQQSTLIRETASAIAVHCDQDELNDIADPLDRFLEAFECGDELFSAPFNEIDGSGANVGNGMRYTRTPRADLRGAGEWFNHIPARATGPNSQACEDCHLTPFGDGAGFVANHAVRDPSRGGILSQFIERESPHLFGLGARQRLAEEASQTMIAARTAARATAVAQNRVVTIQLTAKGVNFGSLGVAPVAANDVVTGLQGIDADLIPKPFQWKGSVKLVRDFVRGADNAELGMQAIELVGTGVDGDGDGVVNELGFGDISALTAYMATQARPVTKLELDAAGLLDPALTAAQRATINRGSAVFGQVGCATCHVPTMTLNNPNFQEPSADVNFRDTLFPSGANAVASGVDFANPIRANLITDLPDNMDVATPSGGTVDLGGLERGNLVNGVRQALVHAFSDMKRHDMGPGLAEPVADDGVAPNVWMTRSLWGAGRTGPYLHDGRATTFMSAILEHGGEALASRNAVVALPAADRAALVAFLDNLTLFQAPEPAAPPAAADITATVSTQSDWGAGYCQVLTVTNNGTATAAAWSVVVNVGASTVNQTWNASRSANTGTITFSSQFPWQSLAPGGSTAQTGWCALRNPANNGAIGTVVSATAL